MSIPASTIASYVGMLERAKLSANGADVKLDFNPKRLSISRRSMWQQAPVRDPSNGSPHLSGRSGSGGGALAAVGSAISSLMGGSSTPGRVAAGFSRSTFRGSQPGALRVTALFDATFDLLGDISSSIGTLESWTHIPANSTDHQPPTVTFTWGRIRFVGYLASLTVNYLSFRFDGTPLAAEADIAITEEPEVAAPTNPSSGGIAGRRTHTMAAGDSLQSIATREYGNPNHWRTIAAANGIDDPLRVPMGTELLIPAATESGG